MDINLAFTLASGLITVTAFIVTTAVLVNLTRADLKEFKNSVESRLTVLEADVVTLKVDIAEIKAICRERSGKNSPV